MGVGGVATGGDFAVAVVGVEEFVDRSGVKDGVGLVATDDSLVVKVVNHHAEVNLGASAGVGDPLVQERLEVNQRGGGGLIGGVRVGSGGGLVRGVVRLVGEDGGSMVVGLQGAVEQAEADDGSDHQHEE